MLDVIIIGAGSAGLAALRDVRRRTDRFLIVNEPPYGTTCARVGCMPSKVLIEAANAFHRRHAFAEFGIEGSEHLRVDLPAALARVRRLRDGFVRGVLEATEGLGERSVTGRARLVAADTIDVDGHRFRARRIVLATGSSPIVPAAWRALGPQVLTTDELFEQTDLPRRLAVIGLGAIGAEMALALARLGLEVQGFDLNERLAGVTDPEVATAIETAMRREVALHLGTKADLAADDAGLHVRLGDRRVDVDAALVALGRRPNVQNLGLETLGVPLDDRGLPPVDPSTQRIADLPVFLAGDANAQTQLLHEAADEGHIAGLNAVADEPRQFRRRTPLAIVFVEPNVAAVGRRFAEIDPTSTAVGAADFRHQGRARAAQRNEGIVRVYADRRSARLVGAELCAPAGEHLVHLLALAIDRELTVHDLLRVPFYHPVLEEGLRTALRAVARELPACGESDLAGCPAFDVAALD